MLHPSAAIREMYSNPDHSDRLQGLFVVRRKIQKVNNREQMTIVTRHDNLKRAEMYCVETFVRIEAEGASEHFLTAAAPINNKEEEHEVERVPEDLVPLLGQIGSMSPRQNALPQLSQPMTRMNLLRRILQMQTSLLLHKFNGDTTTYVTAKHLALPVPVLHFVLQGRSR